MQCHRRLKYNNVEYKDIAEILNTDTGQKTLVILHGYDEYTPGKYIYVEGNLL